MIHISAINGSNHLIINSSTTGNSISFVIDMISPIIHVIHKAIEQPMKTIEHALEILFSAKGPESRTIDYSVSTIQFPSWSIQPDSCQSFAIDQLLYVLPCNMQCCSFEVVTFPTREICHLAKYLVKINGSGHSMYERRLTIIYVTHLAVISSVYQVNFQRHLVYV